MTINEHTRFATVASDATSVAAYLPSNYRVIGEEGGIVVIAGNDSAGWTLDDYVLPRLASGLHFGHEIEHPPLWLRAVAKEVNT